MCGVSVEIMEMEKEFSKEELRRQRYSSLRSTGVLDSMKGQLRARLLEHLRQQNGGAMEPLNKKPSLTERLLSSLFLEYLEAHGFTFTISVFMPESQMASWPPFSYHEMLELLHLDPSIRLKLSGEGRACLAYQLVTVLQQMAQRSCIQEVSTQTSTSPLELEVSMKGVEDACFRKKRLLPYRSLEDKITILHQEFDAQVNAEVALQVSRLREFEINAARMDEAARYRRQLARDREELEDIHKARMDRVKAREESLLERMLSKEKALEASACEQRQKILTEITGVRERESKLRQFKESQDHREEKLDERELSLRAKEEEMVGARQTLYAQADDITILRRKELEEQYKELCDRVHHDRTLLKAEREQMKEEKVAMTIELAASRSDKELIQALQRRQSVDEDQRLSLVKTIRELEEKLKQQSLPAPAAVIISDQRLDERFLNLQAELEQERLQRQAREKENKTLERKLQQKKVELAAARSPQGEWIAEHKNLLATIHQQGAELHRMETKLHLMETEREKLSTKHRMLLLNIDHLDTLVKKAQEGKDRAMCNLEILQVQHRVDERELLETVMHLRKAQQALEAERLENRALRSHMNAVVPSIRVAPQRDRLFQDRHGQSNDLFDHNSSANEFFRKKWESNNWKPQRESRDLWTECVSSQRASLDQNRDRNPPDHFQSSRVSKSFSSGFGYQLLELRDDSIANMSVTKPESLLETIVNGSIEEYYTGSWDQERFSEHTYEDAIPSWRKTYLPEVARPDVVTNRRCEWTKVDMGVCSSSRDPGSAWNHGERDRMRWDMACFEGEEKVGEKYESFDGFRDLEMRTAQIRSASILGPAADIRKLDDSDTCVERKVFFRSENSEEKNSLRDRYLQSSRIVGGATETKRIQNTMEIKCQERLASSVDDHEHEEPFLKEKATNNDEKGHSQSSDYGLTTSTNIQTNLDVSLVENTNIKKDSRISRGSEPNNRTNLGVTQCVVANASLLTMGNIPVAKPTEANNDHAGKQRAETPWNIYPREPNEDARNSSETESLSQDSPTCNCISSLKYELESSEESLHDSIGDHHETADSASDVGPKNPPVTPELDNKQPLNYALQSEILEDKTRQATQERERNATDAPLKLTDEAAMDVAAPDMKQGNLGTPSPTTSTGDSDIAQDPDKDLNQLMRSLGLTVAAHDEQKKREKEEGLLLSEKALTLPQVNSRKEESRRSMDENQCVPAANGKMSGLPEMMFKQEVHAGGEAAQNNLLQDQNSTHEEAQEPLAIVKGTNGDSKLASSQATKLPALEALRTSIVIRKQEATMESTEVDKETACKESPRLLDPMGSHKNQPILALAIRNNQLVKLEAQDESLPKDGNLTPLLNMETIMAPDNETKETPRLVDETPRMQNASQPTHTPEETHSSNEGSIYKGDSFEEEEEDDVDQKPTHSEESCSNEGIRVSSERAQGSLGIEVDEQSSQTAEANDFRRLGKPSENWDGASEQGSYSPDEDDTEADSIESVETCMTQGTTDVHGDHTIS